MFLKSLMAVFAIILLQNVVYADTLYAPLVEQTTITDNEWVALYYINDLRSAKGCNPLQFNTALQIDAVQHSRDMQNVDKLYHSDLYAIHNYQWSMLAENVAYNYPNGYDVVIKGWRTSLPHYENMINCSYEDVGIAQSSNGYYWTMLAGRP